MIPPSFTFTTESELSVREFVDVLRRSTLAERRPVDDVSTMAGMLANADIIIAARNEDGLLVGVSRAISFGRRISPGACRRA